MWWMKKKKKKGCDRVQKGVGKGSSRGGGGGNGFWVNLGWKWARATTAVFSGPKPNDLVVGDCRKGGQQMSSNGGDKGEQEYRKKKTRMRIER